MEKILFSKYSNERSPKFSIVTQILINDAGQKVVRKRAAGTQALAHIKEIMACGQALDMMLKGSGLGINAWVDVHEDALDFEYLTGETLEARIEALLRRQDAAAAEQLLVDYMDRLQALATEDYVQTADFEAVFGTAAMPEGMKSMQVTDIDLIPANIMLKGEEETIIDYEWTFRFPVPVAYVLYRIIFYFITNRAQSIGLADDRLYARYGIDAQLRTCFEQMECCFQAYIEGAHVPVRRMYGDITPGVWSFDQMVDICRSTGMMGGSDAVQIFTAKDGDFIMEQSWVETAADEHYEGVITLKEGENSLRLDPSTRPCLVTLYRFAPEGVDGIAETLDANGHTADGIHYVFETEDPMFVLKGMTEGQTISVAFDVKVIEQSTADQMSSLTDELNQARAQKAAETEHLKNIIGLREAELQEIKATKVWRAYQKYSAARQKLSSGRHRTEIREAGAEPSGCAVACSVDQVRMVGGRAQIQGWAVGENPEDGITVQDMQGNPVEIHIDRICRRDVNESLQVADMNLASGFALTVHESCTEQYVQVIFKDAAGEKRVDVDLGTAIKPKDYDAWMKAKEAEEAVLPELTAQVPADMTAAEFETLKKLTVVIYDYKNQKQSPLMTSLRVQTHSMWQATGFDAMVRSLQTESEGYVVFAQDVAAFRKDALHQILAAAMTGSDFIYWDEDAYDVAEDCYYDPQFKSDYNIDLLRSTNYIGHGFAVRRSLLKQVLTQEISVGRYDYYDLILHLVEAADQIDHIPEVLSHMHMTAQYVQWMKAHETQMSESARASIQAHLKRCGLKAEVMATRNPAVSRVMYHRDEDPLISVIIPNKDHTADLDQCIRAIEDKSTYKNIEYIIVENNSTEEETFAYYKQLEANCPHAHVVYYEGDFNFSRINNFGVRYAKGSYYLLLNNDIEMINPDCLASMLGYCMREDVGIVGARLFYPDDTIQHAGVIVGLGGVAGHAFAGFPAEHDGYCNRIIAAQDLSAVTAACLMVKKELYEAVDGLTENFKVAFNDIDFCLKVRALGKLVVYDPAATLYHYESKSRGYEDTPEKVARFQSEIGAFMERWSTILKQGDPYYNKNLTLDRQDFSLR